MNPIKYVSEWVDRGLRFVHQHPPNFLYIAGGVGPLVSRILPEDTSGSTALLVSLAAVTATVLPRALFSLTREKAFKSACEKNDASTVRAMLRAGFIPAKIDRIDLFYSAISNHHTATAKVLMEFISIEDLRRPNYGRTPLRHAHFANHKETVQALVERLPEEDTRSISRFIFDPQNQHGILRDDELKVTGIILEYLESDEYLEDEPDLIESNPGVVDICRKNINHGVIKELEPIFKELPPSAERNNIDWQMKNFWPLRQSQGTYRLAKDLVTLLNRKELPFDRFCQSISTLLTQGVYFKDILIRTLNENGFGEQLVDHFLEEKNLDAAAEVILRILTRNSCTRSIYLIQMARDYLNQNPPNIDKAFKLAYLISEYTPHVDKKSWILQDIVTAYLVQNPPNVDKAFKVANLIPDYIPHVDEKTRILNDLVNSYLVQDPPRFVEARKALDSISNNDIKCSILHNIARNYLMLKQPLLEKSLRPIDNLISVDKISQFLELIARAYLEESTSLDQELSLFEFGDKAYLEVLD